MKLDELRKLTALGAATNYQAATPESQQQMQKLLRENGFDPENLYQELEMSSPYVNTHRDTSYGFHAVSLHSHTYGELIFCRESDGVEYLVGADRYRLQRGDVIFVPPGISHYPLLMEDMKIPYVRDVIWISEEMLKRVEEMFADSGFVAKEDLTPFRTVGTKWEFLGELFDRGVREEENAKPGWEVAVIGNTLTIISYLKRMSGERSETKIKAEKPELLDRITAYVEGHFAEHIGVADLGKHFYVSSSTISHLFKQKMGVSFYRYVTQRRLIEAKTLINKGKLLEDVALAVGFSDYSSFYRAFKQEYGISPRQYRARQE